MTIIRWRRKQDKADEARWNPRSTRQGGLYLTPRKGSVTGNQYFFFQENSLTNAGGFQLKSPALSASTGLFFA